MAVITTIQLGLTPNFYDNFYDCIYETLKRVLNNHTYVWTKQSNKFKDYDLTFYVITKKGNLLLRTKGPTISKKLRVIDYSIFLPDKVNDLNHYIDLVFEGIGIVLNRYDVSESEVLEMKNECKKELGL